MPFKLFVALCRHRICTRAAPTERGDYNRRIQTMIKYSLEPQSAGDWSNRPHRAGERGQALVFIIIVIAVLAGGWFFLNSMRNDAKVEGDRFAHEFIDKTAFQHDVKWLHSKVSSDRRLQVPPAMDDQFIYYLSQFGVPDRNYSLEGKLDFDSYFVSPHGTYKTILTYPNQHATVNFTIARPSGIWLVMDFGVTYEKPPQ